MGDEERMEILAVIFTVASDAETAGLDGWETETDGLAEGSGVDVGDVVVVTDTTIGEIEALPWDISVWVGGVICGEPGDGHEKSKKKKSKKGGTHQAWTKICLARSEALVVVARRTLAASLSRAWSGEMAIRPKAEAAWAASG